MRKICFGMLLGIFVAAHSFADTYQVKEKIKKVTVYKSSAQIQSDFSKIIKKGDHMMVAIEIPSTIIEESILIKSSTGVQVISIETKLTNLQEEEFAPKIKALKDSIADYSRAIDMEKIKKYAIDQEENLLLANMTFKSNSYTVVDIEELAELYKKRIPELKKESYRLEKSIAAMDKKKVSFQQELNQWRSGKNNKQLWIRINSNADQLAKFELRYLIQEAGWVPSYEIHAKDFSSNVEVSLRANVFQNSGNDWNEVELTLSNAEPNLSSQVPSFYPWMVGISSTDPNIVFSTPEVYSKGNADANIQADPTQLAKPAPMASASEKFNAMWYPIGKAMTIPSDGTGKNIILLEENLKTNFRYQCFPKLDQSAYITAQVYGWEGIITSSGAAKIYSEDMLVGSTFIDINQLDDSLQITLGRDENIRVERKLLKEQNSRKAVGSTRKVSQNFEITARNAKNTPILLEIIDQVPVSTDKDLQITVQQQGATFEELSGQLSWNLKLAPLETKKLSFGYELKYPKNKILSGF